MNIKFVVSKKYNHFFFVQTLADWHFSCRSEYAKEWINQTGPLTSKEKNSLKLFKSIIKKYGFSPLDNCQAANGYDFFMRYNKYDATSPLSKKEMDIYLNAMNCLKPRFDELWKVENIKLQKVEKLLSNKFDETKSGVLRDLKILFKNWIDLDVKIEVVLLLSAKGCGVGGGGANNGPGVISLECSCANIEDTNYLLSTLWHEITHLLLDEYSKQSALIMSKNTTIKDALLKAEQIDFNYSEELISFSIFSPMSFLTDKYFSTEIAKRLKQAVLREDTKWLLAARHIFVIYLIYLNGQFLANMLKEQQFVSPEKMAQAVIKNHEIVKDYFTKNNKKLVWFKYN